LHTPSILRRPENSMCPSAAALFVKTTSHRLDEPGNPGCFCCCAQHSRGLGLPLPSPRPAGVHQTRQQQSLSPSPQTEELMKTEEVDWKEVENTFRRPPSLSGRQPSSSSQRSSAKWQKRKQWRGGRGQTTTTVAPTPNAQCSSLIQSSNGPSPLLSLTPSAVVFHFVPHTF
jgi:hypothetical protein